VLTDRARLYYRAIGEGRPIIVLHGGPDFDHHYLLPEMDRLADSFRLVYLSVPETPIRVVSDQGVLVVRCSRGHADHARRDPVCYARARA
jgi:hypothetical protein